ncbi:hypothetical protein [Krasilnikovia sp. MM14-A1259]|uniref:hypothetical protein n=1 Tax=Krasilnikovia sp. MM14-A1259 TaxID=3373539 RepID=UPI00381DAD66
MAVIELGHVGTGEPDPPAPSPRPSDWGRRYRHRVTAALLAVLCLVTAAGSGRVPAPRGIRPLWALQFGDGDTFALSGDMVVVQSTGTIGHLTGYGRADGVARWSRELATPAPYLIAALDSGVVLLPSAPRGGPPRPSVVAGPDLFTETTAVDARTGAELWHGPGDPTWASVGYGGDGVLLLDHPATGTSAAATRVRMVGLRDGRPVWSRATPGAEMVATVGPDPLRPDRVVTLTKTGRVRMLRLADGAEAGGGTVVWPPGSGYLATSLEWHGDELDVLHTTDAGSTVAAYSGQPLRQRWRIDTPSANAEGCGPVWCLHTEDETIGRDWATGAELWRAPRRGTLTRALGGGLLALDDTLQGQTRIVDARTGHAVTTLGGRPVDDVTSGVHLTLTPTKSADGRTVVSRVDPGTGESFTLGAIDGVSERDCGLVRGLLFCTAGGNKLTVTAVG